MIVYSYTCPTCGVVIHLDDTRLSKNGKKIPIDSRTGEPHPRHQSLAQVFRNRKQIEFADAFLKRCLNCGMTYRAVDRECFICYEITETGDIVPKPGVEEKYGDKAIIEWAKATKHKIPLSLIMRLKKKK